MTENTTVRVDIGRASYISVSCKFPTVSNAMGVGTFYMQSCTFWCFLGVVCLYSVGSERYSRPNIFCWRNRSLCYTLKINWKPASPGLPGKWPLNGVCMRASIRIYTVRGLRTCVF